MRQLVSRLLLATPRSLTGSCHIPVQVTLPFPCGCLPLPHYRLAAGFAVTAVATFGGYATLPFPRAVHDHSLTQRNLPATPFALLDHAPLLPLFVCRTRDETAAALL